MKVRARWGLVWAAAAGTLAAAGGASALEGEFTPETRAKLERRVTIEEEAVLLSELAEQLGEQTGLSFVASAHVAHMPEPVSILARDVPAGELIEAVAFSMHLDVTVTPGGVVSFRLEDDDPRREAIVERMFPPREGPRRDGPPPRVGEREVVERVADHPKVRGILEKLRARLDPAEFVPDKRVWVLAVLREGEEEPLGHVVATEEGEVIDIKMRRADRRAEKDGRGKPFDEEGRQKRLDRERREKRPEGDRGEKRPRREEGERRFEDDEERAPDRNERFWRARPGGIAEADRPGSRRGPRPRPPAFDAGRGAR